MYIKKMDIGTKKVDIEHKKVDIETKKGDIGAEKVDMVKVNISLSIRCEEHLFNLTWIVYI